MAEKLQGLNTSYIGETCYFILTDAQGQYVKGTTLETFNASNWTSYAIAATEDEGTGLWQASMPAVERDLYFGQLRQQVGESPAVDDPVIAAGEVNWTGSEIAFLKGVF